MVLSNSQWLANPGVTYEIDQSIRFNDDDEAHLYNTSFSASPTSSTDCTLSVWVKRGSNFGSNSVIIYGGDPNGSTSESLRFGTGNQLQFGQASSDYDLVTTQVFRDPSAWYHIVAVLDTNNGTESSRAALYVNGSKVTDFATENYPSSSYSTNLTSGASDVVHTVGANAFETVGPDSQHFDGYLAEINFIDGQALTPSSFGETDSSTGQFIPKKYTGSYGTNGFYLKGENSSDLGNDSSGNDNDFTSSGLAANDQVTDVPTNNTATWNPIIPLANGTFSDGNLVFTQSGGSISQHAKSTISFTSGEKKVCEMQTVSGSSITLGICDEDFVANANGFSGDSRGYFDTNGNKVDKDGNSSSYGASFGTSNVIRIEVDLSSNPGTIEFFKDGVSQGDAFTDITSTKTWFFWCRCKADAVKANFGQLGFAGTPTSGFTALNASNMPDPSTPDPSLYFQSTLYTGNGSTQSISQSGENSTFQPDWVWIKNRTTGGNEHDLYDAVRGVTKAIFSSASSAEATVSTGLTAFESDGFAIGSRGEVNTNTDAHVAWQWKANGSGGSNGDGATSSTVSANSTAGFSIVKWTGTGSATTLGHGLGSVPKMIWVKNLADADSWVVYHEDVGNTKGLTLDATSTPTTASTFFNNTTPTSSVFTIGSGGRTNGSSDEMIAYCFSEVESYSKISSYTGNGSTDGTFVYTGFKPAFLLIKNIGATESWNLRDSARDPINVTKQILSPNSNAAESTSGGGQFIDLLSNGFKCRGSDPGINSSATFIFMAFAETPFKTATAR